MSTFLDEIAERIHQSLSARTAARDRTLEHSRTLTRHCANAIRAIHRDEYHLAQDYLSAALQLADTIHVDLQDYPDLLYAGYTQDSLKEFAEARLVYALVRGETPPTPEDLHIGEATYLQGLAEAVGELRRRILDILRHGHSSEAERLLNLMDDIYSNLVTMDYPDAITGGLRRLTDIARSIIERTRGDMTISLRQEQLEASLHRLEEKLP